MAGSVDWKSCRRSVINRSLVDLSKVNRRTMAFAIALPGVDRGNGPLLIRRHMRGMIRHLGMSIAASLHVQSRLI